MKWVPVELGITHLHGSNIYFSKIEKYVDEKICFILFFYINLNIWKQISLTI